MAGEADSSCEHDAGRGGKDKRTSCRKKFLKSADFLERPDSKNAHGARGRRRGCGRARVRAGADARRPAQAWARARATPTLATLSPWQGGNTPSGARGCEAVACNPERNDPPRPQDARHAPRQGEAGREPHPAAARPPAAAQRARLVVRIYPPTAPVRACEGSLERDGTQARSERPDLPLQKMCLQGEPFRTSCNPFPPT
jgi:hypothetical protein